jgi:hypothetical protein
VRKTTCKSFANLVIKRKLNLKINNVERSPKGEIVNLNLEMSNHEIMWFVSFAFNELFKAGLIHKKEDKYELSDQLQRHIYPPQEGK